MPNLKTHGTLKIFVGKSFEKDGETVEYNTAYFLTEGEKESQDVLVVNTKQDLSKQIGLDGDIVVRVGNNGKLGLVSFISR